MQKYARNCTIPENTYFFCIGANNLFLKWILKIAPAQFKWSRYDNQWWLLDDLLLNANSSYRQIHVSSFKYQFSKISRKIWDFYEHSRFPLSMIVLLTSEKLLSMTLNCVGCQTALSRHSALQWEESSEGLKTHHLTLWSHSLSAFSRWRTSSEIYIQWVLWKSGKK